MYYLPSAKMKDLNHIFYYTCIDVYVSRLKNIFVWLSGDSLEQNLVQENILSMFIL